MKTSIPRPAPRGGRHIRVAVRAAHDCGTVLLTIRADYPEVRGGDSSKRPGSAANSSERPKPTHVLDLVPWEQFVKDALGFHPETCRRYMRLAQTPLDQLTSHANTLRQAYQLAGVIPDAEPKERDGSGDKGFNYFSHIAKVTVYFNARVADDPPTKWNDRERNALKETLKPLVDLYAKL